MKTVLILLALIQTFTALAQETVKFRGEITEKSLARLDKKITEAVARLPMDGDRRIILNLSSGGGNLFATLRFNDRMRASARALNFELHTLVTSNCESSCTVLYTVGSHRLAGKRGRFGFHSPKIESRLPKGVRKEDVLRNARARWMAAVKEIDPTLAEELDRKRFLYYDDMSYFSSRELLTGYVNELI